LLWLYELSPRSDWISDHWDFDVVFMRAPTHWIHLILKATIEAGLKNVRTKSAGIDGSTIIIIGSSCLRRNAIEGIHDSIDCDSAKEKGSYRCVQRFRLGRMNRTLQFCKETSVDSFLSEGELGTNLEVSPTWILRI
jgi:hypothetical protein